MVTSVLYSKGYLMHWLEIRDLSEDIDLPDSSYDTDTVNNIGKSHKLIIKQLKPELYIS